jgi:hypothetical protein
MKKFFILVAMCGISLSAAAKGGGAAHRGGHSSSSHQSGSGYVNSQNHQVNGYVKKDGTYVAPSHATNPNGSTHDNYNQKGNVNPYTGKDGTKP